MTTTITTVLTEKEAAKHLGVQRFVIQEAILYASYTRLPAIDSGKGFLISLTDLDRWAESLTPRERLMVFPCTRKGCCCAADAWPHVEETITPDGRPKHGRWLEDSRPKDEHGMIAGAVSGHWSVSINAVGDEPWTVAAEVCAETFPLRDERRLSAEYVIPDVPGLLAALTRAQAKADKLNARR